MANYNAMRRLALAADGDWFLKMPKEKQDDYLKNHPNSKLNKSGGTPTKPKADPNGDAERLKDVKKHITYLRDDIKEIEDDGDDASRERKQLKDLLAELAELQRSMRT